MKSHITRAFGFALVPILSLLSSLFLLPFISTEYGGDGWSALALGQSVGAFLSIIVGLAWPVIGGHRVATAETSAELVSIYALGHYTRCYVLFVVLPAGSVLSFVMAPSFQIEAVLFCVGTALNGLSAAWYFSGLGTATPLVINEGMVRLAGYGLALVGFWNGQGLLFYAIVYVLSTFLSIILNWHAVMRKRSGYARPRVREVLAELRQHSFGTLARLVQGAFTFGGPVLMSGIQPTGLALFTGFDQLQKSGTAAASAVTNSLVQWTSGSARTRYGSRSFVAMTICVGGALSFMGVWMVLGPSVVDYVFAGNLPSSPTSLFVVGTSISLLFTLRSFEILVMVPLGLARIVHKSTLLASGAGIVALVMGGYWFGVNAALASPCVYAVFSMALQGYVLIRRKRLSHVSAVAPEHDNYKFHTPSS